MALAKAETENEAETETEAETEVSAGGCYQHLYCIYLLVFYYLQMLCALHSIRSAKLKKQVERRLHCAPGINIYLFFALSS